MVLGIGSFRLVCRVVVHDLRAIGVFVSWGDGVALSILLRMSFWSRLGSCWAVGGIRIRERGSGAGGGGGDGGRRQRLLLVGSRWEGGSRHKTVNERTRQWRCCVLSAGKGRRVERMNEQVGRLKSTWYAGRRA